MYRLSAHELECNDSEHSESTDCAKCERINRRIETLVEDTLFDQREKFARALEQRGKAFQFMATEVRNTDRKERP